jgi:hypothetical protein
MGGRYAMTVRTRVQAAMRPLGHSLDETKLWPSLQGRGHYVLVLLLMNRAR